MNAIFFLIHYLPPPPEKKNLRYPEIARKRLQEQQRDDCWVLGGEFDGFCQFAGHSTDDDHNNHPETIRDLAMQNMVYSLVFDRRHEMRGEKMSADETRWYR